MKALPPASPGVPGDKACPPPSLPRKGENKPTWLDGTAVLPQKHRSWAGITQASPSCQQQRHDPQRTLLVGPKPSQCLPTPQTKQAQTTVTPEREGQELQLPTHFHSSNSLHTQLLSLLTPPSFTSRSGSSKWLYRPCHPPTFTALLPVRRLVLSRCCSHSSQEVAERIISPAFASSSASQTSSRASPQIKKYCRLLSPTTRRSMGPAEIPGEREREKRH